MTTGQELIAGKYKTNDEAIAGVKAADTQIADLNRQIADLNTKLADATKAKPFAFNDDAGMMRTFGEKKVDLATIGGKVLKDNKYEDADMRVIGEAIRDADPVWLGRKFCELHRHHTLTTITASQEKVMKEAGGEARIKQLVEWQDKNGTKEQKEEWSQQWHGTDEGVRRTALERLEGRFSRHSAGVKATPASEGNSSAAPTAVGGFKDANEWRTAKNASRQKHGPNFYNIDTDYAKRYEATPDNVRRTFTG